jgi:hypothetical protein
MRVVLALREGSAIYRLDTVAGPKFTAETGQVDAGTNQLKHA